jgi:hypothetical protein
MTGQRIAELMRDPHMKRAMARLARRYTRCVEDQEEYIADGWILIAGCQDEDSIEALEGEAYRGMKAAYDRRWRASVRAVSGASANGISVDHASNYKRSDLIPLGRDRYIVRTPEKLSGWYYHGEWEEYGLPKDGMQVRTFYKIVLDTKLH